MQAVVRYNHRPSINHAPRHSYEQPDFAQTNRTSQANGQPSRRKMLLANFIFTYDLNGSRPTHTEMDEHIKGLGLPCGRILETVWYIAYSGDITTLAGLLEKALSDNDRYVLVDANDLQMRKLLVTHDSLISTFNKNR